MSEQSDFPTAAPSPSAIIDMAADSIRESVDMVAISLEELQAMIEAADDIDSELVHCDEWGAGMVLEARAMTTEQKASYMKAVAKASKGSAVVDYKAITLGLVRTSIYKPSYNEDGDWIPGASQVLALAGIPEVMLLRKSAAVTERLGSAVSGLSGLSGADEDEDADEDADDE